MAENEEDRDDPPFSALYPGVVVDRKDPMRVGRVKLRVPGLVEGETDWALPLGTLGCKAYFVPDVGDEVGVLFMAGDVDHPYYLAGPWGAPKGRPQSPGPVGGATPEEAPLVGVLETARHLVLMDGRTSTASLQVVDKSTGNGVKVDGVTGAVEVFGTVELVLRAVGAVRIEGAAVTINGRPVAPGSKPI